MRRTLVWPAAAALLSRAPPRAAAWFCAPPAAPTAPAAGVCCSNKHEGTCEACSGWHGEGGWCNERQADCEGSCNGIWCRAVGVGWGADQPAPPATATWGPDDDISCDSYGHGATEDDEYTCRAMVDAAWRCLPRGTDASCPSDTTCCARAGRAPASGACAAPPPGGGACGVTNSDDCVAEFGNSMNNNGNYAQVCNRCRTEGGSQPLRTRCQRCCEICDDMGGGDDQVPWAPRPATYAIVTSGTCRSNGMHQICDRAECQAARDQLGFAKDNLCCGETFRSYWSAADPTYCFVVEPAAGEDNANLYFNPGDPGNSGAESAAPCGPRTKCLCSNTPPAPIAGPVDPAVSCGDGNSDDCESEFANSVRNTGTNDVVCGRCRTEGGSQPLRTRCRKCCDLCPVMMMPAGNGGVPVGVCPVAAPGPAPPPAVVPPPPRVPTYAIVTSGTCKSNGMHQICGRAECQAARDLLGIAKDSLCCGKTFRSYWNAVDPTYCFFVEPASDAGNANLYFNPGDPSNGGAESAAPCSDRTKCICSNAAPPPTPVDPPAPPANPGPAPAANSAMSCGTQNSQDCDSEFGNSMNNNGNYNQVCNRCSTEGGSQPLRTRCQKCCDLCPGAGSRRARAAQDLTCGTENSGDCESEFGNSMANSGNYAQVCGRCRTEGGSQPLRKRCRRCCEICDDMGGGPAPAPGGGGVGVPVGTCPIGAPWGDVPVAPLVPPAISDGWPAFDPAGPVGDYMERPLVGPTVQDEGGELRGNMDASLDDCKRMCDQTQGCNSFSYSANLRDCWLKDRCVTLADPVSLKLRSEPHWKTYYKASCPTGVVRPRVVKLMLKLGAALAKVQANLNKLYKTLLRLLTRRIPRLIEKLLTVTIVGQSVRGRAFATLQQTMPQLTAQQQTELLLFVQDTGMSEAQLREAAMAALADQEAQDSITADAGPVLSTTEAAPGYTPAAAAAPWAPAAAAFPSSCFGVAAGTAAPSDGEWYAQGSETGEWVLRGAIAPSEGTFCPSSYTPAPPLAGAPAYPPVVNPAYPPVVQYPPAVAYPPAVPYVQPYVPPVVPQTVVRQTSRSRVDDDDDDDDGPDMGVCGGFCITLLILFSLAIIVLFVLIVWFAMKKDGRKSAEPAEQEETSSPDEHTA